MCVNNTYTHKWLYSISVCVCVCVSQFFKWFMRHFPDSGLAQVYSVATCFQNKRGNLIAEELLERRTLTQLLLLCSRGGGVILASIYVYWISLGELG